MANKYTLRVNSSTMASSVHSPSCNVVKGNQPKGFAVWQFEAASAKALVEQFEQDEQVIERQLPRCKICPCVKG
jgi:hypothetical protein